MYAGCATKSGSVKYYAFPEGASCLWDVGRLTRNLSVIAEPYIGIPLLFGGIVSGGMGLAMLYVHLRRCFHGCCVGEMMICIGFIPPVSGEEGIAWTVRWYKRSSR